jgi:hypothetical protein
MSRRPSLIRSERVSTVTAASPRPAADETTPAVRATGVRSPRDVAGVLALTAILVAIPFVTKGGVDETVASPGNTWTEIALILLGAVAVSASLFCAPPRRRRYGLATVGAMFVLFALTAASVAWSVVPDSSWLASGQMLAYLAVLAGGVSLVRLAPRNWTTVLGALVLSTAVLGAWSLLVKVFPATLAVGNTVGRLQAPFGYWNALALSSACGLPCCLWLASRREGDRRLAGLAAPAIAVLVAVLVLSYSRSADLAAVAAAGLWLIFVPLRLRAVAMLAVGGVGGAVLSVWGLTHHGINGDKVAPAAQDSAGHVFGIVILVTLVLVTVAGVLAARWLDRHEPSEEARTRAGAGLVGLLAVGVLAAVLGLATSSRGLTGQISYGWHELTNPNAVVSANSAGRVLQFGSSRPLYWHVAIAVGNHATFKGVGALGFSEARLRYTTNPEPVLQAHSYVFETYADLGVLGLLASAALLGAWLTATGRAIGVGRAWSQFTAEQRAERIGLITLAVFVVGFGIQSTLDWTWYFAGISVPALLAAGWLAGRGQVGSDEALPARRRLRPLDHPGAAMATTLLVAVVLASGWMIWRPLHSAQLVNAAEDATTGAQASHDAHAAQSADPLSLAPYELLSQLASNGHDPGEARAQLERATRVQPDNPDSWFQLGRYLVIHREWPAVLVATRRASMLDLTDDQTKQTLAIWSGVATEKVNATK